MARTVTAERDESLQRSSELNPPKWATPALVVLLALAALCCGVALRLAFAPR